MSSPASIAGLLRASALKKQMRIERVKELAKVGRKEVGALTKRDRFVAGLALYWGEGYKNTSDETGFTNSDPAMIKFFIRWLLESYRIPKSRLILRVSINNAHAHRVKEVEAYWSRTAGIPLSRFTQASLIKSASKKRYANSATHFGTLRVKVRRGTDLRRRILGSIERLKEG